MTSDFETDAFDVHAWINAALKGSVSRSEDANKGKAEEDDQGGSDDVVPEREETSEENVETVISGLILRLQQDSQELNSQLEEEMSRILGSIPRALRELDRISRDSDSVKKSLSSLEERVETISGQTPATTADDLRSLASAELEITTMDTLEHLHLIKTNLDKSLQVLEKTAAWDRLVSQVEANFASRDLVGVAEKIGGLRKSLEMLHGMPEEEKRNEVLHRMEQRLETLIGPGLRKAITACLDAEKRVPLAEEGGLEELDSKTSVNKLEDEAEQDLHAYVNIFEKLGRLDHLCRDFAEARGAFFLEDWNLLSTRAKESGTKFNSWVSRFFEQYIASLEREKARCERVFGAHTQHVLRRIVSDSLGQISAGFQKELSMLHISDVVVVFEKTCQFGDQVIGVCNVALSSSEPSIAGTTPEIETTQVLGTLLAPFKPFFDNYREIELKTLVNEFQTSAGKLSEQTFDSLLGDPAVIQLVSGAVDRCHRFTHGAKVPELLSSIDSFWADFLSQCVQTIRLSLSTELQSSDKTWEDRTFASVRHLQAVAGLKERLDEFIKVRLCKQVAAACKSLNERVGQSQLENTANWLANNLHDKAPDQSIYIQLEENTLATIEELAFARTEAKLSELILSARTTVYETMLAPIVHEWSSLAKMRVWAVDTDEDAKALGPGEESISEFGGPLKYMTKVTDHMLTLVQLLEPFASKTVSATLLPDPLHLGSSARSALEDHLGLEPESRARQLLEHFSQDSNLPAEDDEDLDLFSPPWLGMIALGAVDSLLLQVLKIDVLGSKGAKQLASDLGCLDNAVSSIASPDPLLLQVQNALQMTVEELSESTSQSSQEDSLTNLLSIILAKRLKTKIDDSPQN